MRKFVPIRFLPGVVLLCALGVGGCHRKPIVRAAPPSVSASPVLENPELPEPTPPPTVETKTEPLPETAAPVPPPAPAKKPAVRPRPTPAETAPAKPVPPQISPQLSPQDLARAEKSTTSNITTAEKNLQLANGRQLSAAQKDLTEKIGGFLSQSHEAILADDWVRAENLAEKARVLSVELVKSF